MNIRHPPRRHRYRENPRKYALKRKFSRKQTLRIKCTEKGVKEDITASAPAAIHLPESDHDRGEARHSSLLERLKPRRLTRAIASILLPRARTRLRASPEGIASSPAYSLFPISVQ